jgi:type I restriction enzyme, S subunit
VNRHWGIRLGDVVEIKGGGTPSTTNPAFWNGDIPWVSPKDMKSWVIADAQDKITAEAVDASATNLVPAGSILVVNRSGILKHTLPVGITDRPVAINQDIKALICGPMADPGFLAHIVKAAEPIVLSWVRATTADNFSVESLRNLEIPLPPLDEQRRIAAILDKADALRQKRKRAIALLDSLTQSIFADMFGDPAHNRLGLPVGKIGDLLDSATYGSSGKAGPTGEYPMLRMGNLTTAGRMDYSDLKYIDLADGEVERYTVKRGDILFNRTNSAELVGKTAVFDRDDPHAFAGYLVRARTKSGYSPEYVSGYLNSSHGKKTLRGMAKSIVGMANINAKEMQTIPILVPDQASQQQYAKLIEGIRERQTRYEDSLRESEHLFTSLQDRAFSGQL